jgi:DtxR family Mn-dependent transcriptional regulator
VEAPKNHSRAVEDYLKAIYKLQEDFGAVSTTALAEELRRSAASVTNMVKSLADQRLLEHEPYHGVRLTPHGEATALRIIRRHRVIESYLIEKLGYTWDGVHPEAERLEHAASEMLIDAMARALGDPQEDPHGSPIPTPSGQIADRNLERLVDLPIGAHALVREVPDDDSGRLRNLASIGLVLGVEIQMRGPVGGGNILAIRIAGLERKVSRQLAAVVLVDRTA